MDILEEQKTFLPLAHGKSEGIHDSSPPGHKAGHGNYNKEKISRLVHETTAWDVYNNEAKKVDTELVKDWTSSLNFLLLFAAIFSAILAAFIIESKKLLEEDQSRVMVDAMIFYSNTLVNRTNDTYTRPKFEPTYSAISINCLLFGSLSASLVAALASVVALQWVADFDAAITRGGSSPQDRAKRRQIRFAGVEKWKMGGIIAALPLLLYSSVVLFFAGVIQWMLILNYTVGCVVVGGAVIVVLFYVSSTVIAVIFVAAPFKTPLSRWIYYAYTLSFTTLHRILVTLRLYNVPHWIEARRWGHLSAHKREDLAITSHGYLRYHALHWLAIQINVSEDSRRRLVLLVKELLEWPSAQLDSKEFKGGSWISILNFLAQKHRDMLHIVEQTRQEEQELAILVHSSALPGGKAMISPTHEHEYEWDATGDEYWSQNCVNSGHPEDWNLWDSLGTPDVLFLLTRDLPVPSLHSQEEMNSVLRLAKWRNSEAKPLEVWQGVFNSADDFSDDFFSSCVNLLCRYARSIKYHPSSVSSHPPTSWL